MRIVLDTNVLVSGLLSPQGPPGRILDLVVAGKHQLLLDDRIVAEYRAVLSRPRFGFAPDDVAALVEFLEATGEWVAAQPSELTLADPGDLPFAQVAAAGLAHTLVTGNPRHFPASRLPATLRVVTPREFLEHPQG